MIILGIIIFVVGIILIIIAKNQKKLSEIAKGSTKVLIKDIKPGMPIEISGIIEAPKPIKTPFTNRPCVYYEYELERREESQENPGQYVWRRIAQDSSSIPFWVRDDTGHVTVYPESAKIEAAKIGERVLEPEAISSNPVVQGYFSLIENYTTRAREKALLVSTPVHILGEAMPTEKETVIQKGRSPFLISNKTEQDLQKELERNVTVTATIGILGLIGGIVLIVVGLLF